MTLLHRRTDLSETMSDYLIHDLERAGVVVRGRSEIVELHGSDGRLEAATLRDGERIALAYLFLFLGALPCSEWLSGTVALDDDGFVLTGAAAGAEGILETSAPGIFAVGDIRSGVDQALRDGHRRGSHGRPLRARALPTRRPPCVAPS